MQRGFHVLCLMCCITGFSIPASAADAPATAPREPIGYIRPDAPSVPMGEIRGQRFEDLVPDTLDISERIDLAINGLTAPTDSEADYELYFWADFFRNPPIFIHNFDSWCQPKFMEALPLLRLASGSQLNSQVDPVWRQVLLKSQGPDGLYYIPLKGRPWARINHTYTKPLWRADGTTTDLDDPTVEQFAHPFTSSRAISAMIVHYQIDQSPVWRDAIEMMIAGLTNLAIDKGDYCYYPEGIYEPNVHLPKDVPMPISAGASETNGRVIQCLGQYYRITKHEPARQLGAKLVKYMLKHSRYYDKEGRFIADPATGDAIGGHFHAHTFNLLAMLDFAIATDDRQLIEFVRMSFEWARAQGEPLVGFFPTNLSKTHYPESETCQVSEMIAMAIKLSEAGAGDYWDDADRWIRNQLAENQLTQAFWVHQMPRFGPVQPIAFNETNERVPQRSVGAFAGWPSANDWLIRKGIMHCCTGNASRTLYYIWNDMVRVKDGTMTVNLLLNRASPMADIHSYIPYEGQVDIRMKQEGRVRVRAPEWIPTGSDEVRCTVGDEARAVEWDGRYLNLGMIPAGKTAILRFPITERAVNDFDPTDYSERRVGLMIGDGIYSLVIKGNTVVYIDPPGKNIPLYQRANLRENKVRWRKIQRFVPERTIEW